MRYFALCSLLAALMLPSCASGGDGADEPLLRFVVVTHGQASDPFWSRVQQGARQAGRDVGVRVEYQAPESFDMVTMGQLIDAAVASQPDGLIVSMPDADALGLPIERARKDGIPVISINSGYDHAEEFGMLVHVGQTEYEAGYESGERMAASGVSKALCINQEVGNLALDRRCEGFAAAMATSGAKSELLAVELADPTESEQRIRAALRRDDEVDGLLTLGPTGALPALRAVEAERKGDAVSLASFDVTPEILSAIEGGDMLFAVDQQPFLQGYLPVVLLALHCRRELMVANDVVRTGPGFVTPDNVALRPR